MRAALRTMDRYLVCQVIQVLLEPIVEDYIARWLHATDMGEFPPDALDLAEAATSNGVPILSFHPLRAYIDACARGNRVPDPARIIQTIVHGHAEMNFAFDKPCRCPARKVLVPSPYYS